LTRLPLYTIVPLIPPGIMSLSVLTDEQIRILLENLTIDELEKFRNELKGALHEYSNGTQAIDDGVLQQPERMSTHSATTGCTTLFMPSSGPAGHGVKGNHHFP
jgi:hypothetical protein